MGRSFFYTLLSLLLICITPFHFGTHRIHPPGGFLFFFYVSRETLHKQVKQHALYSAVFYANTPAHEHSL